MGDVKNRIRRVRRAGSETLYRHHFIEFKEFKGESYHKLREHLRPAVYHVLIAQDLR